MPVYFYFLLLAQFFVPSCWALIAFHTPKKGKLTRQPYYSHPIAAQLSSTGGLSCFGSHGIEAATLSLCPIPSPLCHATAALAGSSLGIKTTSLSKMRSILSVGSAVVRLLLVLRYPALNKSSSEAQCHSLCLAPCLRLWAGSYKSSHCWSIMESPSRYSRLIS